MLTPTPVIPATVPIIGSLTNALVDTYVKPKLQMSARRGNRRKALDELTFFGGLKMYLERAYERHSHLTTLALQGKPRLLSELYIPLTLVKSAHTANEREELLIDRYHHSLLPERGRVLLTDDAGMGKSTLVKFLFLKCVETNSGLPIIIELRRLREGKSIPDVLVDELCEVCPEVAREAMSDAVRDLLDKGDFVFFLDGYDEVPFDERERVALHLREFIARVGHNGRNAFLVSSRPDSGVSSLPGFHGFHIRPLEVEEAFALLRRYDNNGSLSGQLIAELEKQMGSVKEFLTNPMLVSLLFEAYDYTRNIPLKKAAFYRQVYDAIFERHDATKPLFKREKHSKLDKDDFERVLRALGIRTIKSGIGYSKDELLSHITEARRMCPGLTFSESDFLQDLLTTVPLFAREGDYHRWKHKSLQEYFAARYLCGDISKEEQAKVLRQMVDDGSYQNVLSLCYDLDYRTFRNTVIYDMIVAFLTFCETSYSNIPRSDIPQQAITERQRICFGRNLSLSLDTPDDDIDDDDLEQEEDIPAKPIFLNSPNNMGDPLINFSAVMWPDGWELHKEDQAAGKLMLLLERKRDTTVQRMLSTLGSSPAAFLPSSIERGTSFTMDEAASIMNEAKSFTKVNELLREVTIVSLDPQVCHDLKLEIEADLEREKSASVLSLL